MKTSLKIILPLILIILIIGGIVLFLATKGTEPDFNCGNGICEYRESTTCPQDCEGGREPICGDGWCDLGEFCQVDCHNQPKEYCGDGICQESRGEDKHECPMKQFPK